MGIFDGFFKPPSKDKFAKMVADAVRGAGETGRIVYDREQFYLSRAGGDGPVTYLGNAYQEYCSSPKEIRAEIVKKWVRNWFAVAKGLPDEFDDVHPDLLPAVRCRSYFELNQLRLTVEGKEPPEWPYQVFGEHFGIGLVYDMPASMRIITQGDLDIWDVTLFEAMEAAQDSFKERQHPFISPQEGPGLYLSAAKDSYDATRIILLDLIRHFQVKGDPIAMIPSRNTLIVAGSEDSDSLGAMLSLAQEAMNEPWRILGIALRLDGDEWVPWLPEPSHPLYKDFKDLEIQSLGQDYAEQKELLDRLHEKTGEDVFVASFSGMENNETGEIVSYAVWSKGVPTLLPRTDRLAFVRADREPVMASWNRVQEVVGDMMEPVEIYPPRWKVGEFPSDEQLEMMGAE